MRDQYIIKVYMSWIWEGANWADSSLISLKTYRISAYQIKNRYVDGESYWKSRLYNQIKRKRNRKIAIRKKSEKNKKGGWQNGKYVI